MQAIYMYVVLLVIIKTWIDLLRRDCSAVAFLFIVFCKLIIKLWIDLLRLLKCYFSCIINKYKSK